MKEKVRLTINGEPFEAEQGMTLLQVARQNGIHIPTLCYNEVLRPLESCRLCIVGVEGESHFQASCSTQVREGMVVTTDSEEIQQMRKLMLELLLKEHYGDCVAPCQLTCPAGIDIQGYIALISQGQYLEALQLIRERIPMPLTIGRVCPHFCEYKCNRNLVEEPININHLKRFVADYEMYSGQRNPPPLADYSGQRVAIIGGGPAGLSAAYYLRRLGHGSTLFDAMPELGGMLRYGIPEYRLPKKILDWEIDGILQLGNIDVKLGKKWGEDFTLETLKQEGYDVFLIAIGAWDTRKLGIVGEDLKGVYAGVDFLVDLALGKPVDMGNNVAIVGGGNVAIDAARNSIRLGAETVTILYRRSREEMPASPEEIHGAEEEGVRFHFLAAPVRLFGSHGQVDKLEYVKMELGEPDASGRRRPVPKEGSETVIPVDMVIAAIGQFPNLSPVDADKAIEGIPTTRWNTFGADPETMYTGIEGVFTGGDVYRGPETVVGALADGRKAATAIHVYLRDKKVQTLPKPFNILKGDLETIEREQFSSVSSEARAQMPELPAAERVKHSEQIELGLSEESARQEAERCLSCGCLDAFDCKLRKFSFEFGVDTTTRPKPQIPIVETAQRDTHQFIAVDPNKCIRCKQCFEACTYFQCSDAVDFEDTPSLNSSCVFCGLCLDMCPTGALEERISGRPGPFHYEEVESFCPHCGCGCNLVLNIKGNRLFTVTTRPTTPPNYGYTCRQGRFDSFAYLRNGNRLQTPLVRKHGKLVEVSWEAALKKVTTEFKRIQEEHGATSLAAIGSPRATNEANYLLQKIFRTQLGSNNVDYPGGQSHLATLTGLLRTLGRGAMTNSLSEIEKAEVIFALGNRIEENNPIVATALRRASRTHGCRVVTVSSSEVATGKFADPAFVMPKENTLEFLQSLLKLLLESNLYDKDFVAVHTKGIQDLEESLAHLDHLDTVGRVDILPSTFQEVAGALARASSLAIVYSEDLVADADGKATVEALANLALLTGRLGQQHSGIYPLYRYINVQGVLDMGLTPAYYPGHVALSNVKSKAHFSKVWSGQLPTSPGLGYREILEGANAKRVKGLYLMCENPIATEPERDKILDALNQVEFLAVQDVFLTQCAELADVVLPSAGFAEQEGTLTNVERRTQKLKAALKAPGRALPDWRILADLLARFESGTSYPDVHSVYQEIMSVVPFYEGITYDLLDSGGLQWPYPKGESSPTLTLDLLKKPLEFAAGD
ncbi:MAG: molybdopterin-dependent oxidoreductase [Deltaproteobacteria bacterium]|nr:MAG: molybdopterin-dependent oxidoreductase [Deltaproteobacteria bacterium]